jgi:hypothetical protein
MHVGPAVMIMPENRAPGARDGAGRSVPPLPRSQSLIDPDLSPLPLDRAVQLVYVALLEHMRKHLQHASRTAVECQLRERQVALAPDPAVAKVPSTKEIFEMRETAVARALRARDRSALFPRIVVEET